MFSFETNETNRNHIIIKNKETENKNRINENGDDIKKEKSIELYQESNSMSHLSTTSEGDQIINNNLLIYQTNPSNNTKCKNKKNYTFKESIKKGIRDLNKLVKLNKENIIPCTCLYYCDIDLTKEENKFFFGTKIQKLIEEFKSSIERKKVKNN